MTGYSIRRALLALGMVIILAAAAALCGGGQANAADLTLRDRAVMRRAATEQPAPLYRLIPRSREAQAVWTADACWRGCTQQCNWDFQARLPFERSGKALAKTGRCDRVCVDDCRTAGGPLLNLTD
jgi:hypothetical protein